MNFGFSPEQELLRTNARTFLERECPSMLLRQLIDNPEGHISELWRNIAALGWTGLLIPEAWGGLGLTTSELVVVLEEMGRVLFPGPYLSTVVLGATTLLLGGTTAQQRQFLPRIASGEIQLTLALTEPSGRWDAAAVATCAQLTENGYELVGTKLYVPEAHLADYLLVVARTRDEESPENRLSVFLVERQITGLSCHQLPTMDPTRRWYEVKLDHVRLAPDALVGPLHGAWPLLVQVLDWAIMGLCAEMCGAAQRVLEMSVDYAKSRVTFGKPIGAYQAIKHKCADMLLQIENAKSLTYYAAWACQAGVPETSQAASMAKAYTTEMFCQVTAEGIQLHGGIGFTWDHDMHLYYKRAQSSRFLFGDARWHRDRLARALETS